MFKYYAIAVSFILTVIGISKIPVKIKPENLPVVQAIPDPTPVDHIQIKCDKTCTDKELNDLPRLVALVNAVEASQCFKNYLSNGKLDLTQTKGQTLQQVIDAVTLTPMTSEITYYSQKRNPITKNIVVGYENGDGKIHANRIAWNDMTDCEKAGNIAHELTHASPLSYSHDYNNTARRPFSVPYMVGSALIACCK